MNIPNPISAITDAASNLVNSAGNVISRIVKDPNQAAELNAEITKMTNDFQSKVIDHIGKIQELASKSEQNKDPYVRRARPTFLYLMYAILLANYIVFPSIGKPPIEFPEPLFWLFGSGFIGYAGLRSWDKLGGKKKE